MSVDQSSTILREIQGLSQKIDRVKALEHALLSAPHPYDFSNADDYWVAYRKWYHGARKSALGIT